MKQICRAQAAFNPLLPRDSLGARTRGILSVVYLLVQMPGRGLLALRLWHLIANGSYRGVVFEVFREL